MNPALGDLYRLQEIDTALAKRAKMLRDLDAGTAEKEAYDNAVAAEQRALSELRQAEAALKDAELELQTLENKQRDHTALLFSGKIRNPKELEGLQQEVESLKRRRSVLDERVLELMDRVEKLSAEEATLRAKKEKALKAYRTKAEAYVEAARALRDEIAKLQQERTSQASRIAPPLLRRYDAVRQSKGGVGVARVDGSRCSACRTILPRSTLLAVRDTEDIVVCEACSRLLCILPDG